MTDERKVELITKLKNWLQPENLTVYDRPDPNVEGSDGSVTFYDYLCVTFGKDAEEQAVLDEQLVKTIAAKCGYPIAIVDKSKSDNNTGHFFTVWFKRLPQPEAPAPSANESAVSPPEPPTPAKESSVTESDYNKVTQALMEDSRIKHRLSIFQNLFAAGIGAGLMACVVYGLVSGSSGWPTYLFVCMVFGAVICGLYTISAIFSAGIQAARMYSEPELWEKESKYQKLLKDFEDCKIQSRKDYNCLAKEYADLFFFVKNKSPGLLAEFSRAREEQEQLAEEKKE